MLQGINTEVRYMIFEMLLQLGVEIDETTCIEPAILLTCRQFYNEAKPVLCNKFYTLIIEYTSSKISL